MNVFGWERIVVAGIVLALVPWIVRGLRRTPAAPADRRTVGGLCRPSLQIP